MLFRPSYCCNCGEKIERANWKLWTSRRFCELCETDFTLQEIIPKLFAVIGVLITIIGIGNFFLDAPKRTGSGVVKLQDRPANTQPQASNTQVNGNLGATSLAGASSILPVAGNQQIGASNTVAAPSKQLVNARIDADVPIYFCGAETKKGTPCTRKVKGNVRCWQHTGQPAMLTSDKLRADR